jgi:hypothetical protein
VPEHTHPRFSRKTICALVFACLLGGVAWALAPDNLPRFTEEREAAALCFVKKNLPELLPLLSDLKKTDASRYEGEIREIFQVTEYLAELREDPRRYDLELKIWITESKANALAAELPVVNLERRKEMEAQLQDLVKELVALDAQVLEHKAAQLEQELRQVRDELARIREQGDKRVRERFGSLVEKAKKQMKK